MFNVFEWFYVILGLIGVLLVGWKIFFVVFGMSDILVLFYIFDDWYIKY